MSDGEREAGKWPTTELPTGWVWTKFAAVFDNVTSTDLKLKQKEYAEKGTISAKSPILQTFRLQVIAAMSCGLHAKYRRTLQLVGPVSWNAGTN